MASYHLSVKVGGKGKALSHANYIARAGQYEKRRDDDLVYVEAGNMPRWAMHNPAEFWAAADTYERANGCAYREIEIAIPRELTEAQRLALVQDFVQQEVGERHAYQFAIHNPKAAIDGGEQPHAHIMFSERLCDGIDRDPQQYFKRANSKHPERGGAKKERFGETPSERKEYLVEQRHRWAVLQNYYLKTYQHGQRVSARSYLSQGINRRPERHLGAFGVRKLDTEQSSAIIERREAENAAMIDLQSVAATVDLPYVIEDILNQQSAEAFSIPGPDEIAQLVSQAMDDIQQDIDLQALIEASVNEFSEIDAQIKRQAREAQAEANRWPVQERRPVFNEPEPIPKPTQGWSMKP